MPITEQQLLQILPNAGKQAGVFASALNLAMERFQICFLVLTGSG
jgi:putative chitinase